MRLFAAVEFPIEVRRSFLGARGSGRQREKAAATAGGPQFLPKSRTPGLLRPSLAVAGGGDTVVLTCLCNKPRLPCKIWRGYCPIRAHRSLPWKRGDRLAFGYAKWAWYRALGFGCCGALRLEIRFCLRFAVTNFRCEARMLVWCEYRMSPRPASTRGEGFAVFR